MDKKLFFYELECRGYIFKNKRWDETKHSFEDDVLNMVWEMWSSAKHGAKAQAVPEGYKVVPVNYECVWCGCTELDGWADETMIEAQEPAKD